MNTPQQLCIALVAHDRMKDRMVALAQEFKPRTP